MAKKIANNKLAEIALDRISGDDFESFVNEFYPAAASVNFIPLGGKQDGGADGFAELERVYSDTAKTDTFYQVTRQPDYRSKIKHTVKRLKEFGREPRKIIFITSQKVKHKDIEQEKLAEERVKQAAAIRRWKPWEQSTGAKTPKGRESSKMNALKSGAYTAAMQELRRLLKDCH